LYFNPSAQVIVMQLIINTPGTLITQKDECFHLKQQGEVFNIIPYKISHKIVTVDTEYGIEKI
jgi:hypothetical protein